MPNVTDALKYAAQNPDSPFAAELRRRLESGMLDSELKAEGYNLSSFKSAETPAPTEAPKSKNILQKIGEGISNLSGLGGAAKAVAGAGAVLEQSSIGNRVNQAGTTSSQLVTEAKKLPQGDPRRTQLLNQAAQIDSGASQLAESSLSDLNAAPTSLQSAGSFGKGALNAATFGSSGIATSLVGRSLELGITGAAMRALDNVENKKKSTEGVLTAGLAAGALPAAGKTLSLVKNQFGKLAQKGGNKIVTNIIKPVKSDLEDGFKVETINKYNLGGSLKTMSEKTDAKIKELSTQLSSKIKRSDATLDLNEVVEQTAKDILGGKTSNFGNNAAIRRVLTNLGSEVEEVSANGLVDLSEAQLVKQAAGKKGAWVFANPDPDATAIEKVYTAFYRNLRQKIEEKAPTGIREINKQLSELIPVQHAIIRRIPVAERNNAISLTDLISLGASAVNPWAITLFAGNRLSKSGRFGALLSDVGSKIKSNPATTNIGKRVFGR